MIIKTFVHKEKENRMILLNVWDLSIKSKELD